MSIRVSVLAGPVGPEQAEQFACATSKLMWSTAEGAELLVSSRAWIAGELDSIALRSHLGGRRLKIEACQTEPCKGRVCLCPRRTSRSVAN